MRRIGGVLCLTAPMIDDGFLNRALGVGTIADATPELLSRIERHYAGFGRPSRISVAQGCVPAATMRLLERRGYAPLDDHGEQIYVFDGRRLPGMPALPDGVTIERVAPSGAAEYARAAAESFPERGPMFPRIIEALVRSDRRWIRTYLARVDGEPAGTGMTFDVGPVAGLGNGSVRPKFRGRGLQTALIAHRMGRAWARGIRLFFGETENPVSAHNMEDLGWRKLYDQIAWERPTAHRSEGA